MLGAVSYLFNCLLESNPSVTRFACDVTDRCVAKYMDGQQLIGEVLRKANEAQMQQQQQMVQLQQQMGG